MKTNKILIVPLVLILACSCTRFQQQKVIENTYTNKDEIIIDVSPISQYTITASRDQYIHIHVKNADAPTVRYTIDETDRALRLSDKDLNYHPNRPTPHDIYKWTLELPNKMKVKCKCYFHH